MLKTKSYVYRFLNKEDQVIYVGKTNNLNKRYMQHFSKRGHLSKECYNSVAKIEYITETSELNALLLETYYINKFRPKYNKLNKTYRATSIQDVNLKQINESWKTFKVLSKIKTNTSGRPLTLKENLIFYSATIAILAIFTIAYFKY